MMAKISGENTPTIQIQSICIFLGKCNQSDIYQQKANYGGNGVFYDRNEENKTHLFGRKKY